MTIADLANSTNLTPHEREALIELLQKAIGELHSWIPVSKFLPNDGDWVLHASAGVRRPEYGKFENGNFFNAQGSKVSATHWLAVPMISLGE